ncbi:hypothetical protein GALL_155220 [mine drainage metagenome]|uniref:Uncharacterized protein n=1 Tax=mine drainage metagenome TaxID=410659 RepID=A0A1J5SDT4_9ZZZZ
MALNARAKSKNNQTILFDVFYDDGSRSSNRKVPASECAGQDEENAAKAYIAEQDRQIAAASGCLRGDIKKITRSAK